MLRSRRRCKSGSCLDFLRIYDKHFSRLVKGRTEQNSCSKTESPLKRHKSNFFHISLRVVEDAIWSLISIYISIWRICYCFWRRRAAILETQENQGETLNRVTVKNERSLGTLIQTLFHALKLCTVFWNYLIFVSIMPKKAFPFSLIFCNDFEFSLFFMRPIFRIFKQCGYDAEAFEVHEVTSV